MRCLKIVTFGFVLVLLSLVYCFSYSKPVGAYCGGTLVSCQLDICNPSTGCCPPSICWKDEPAYDNYEIQCTHFPDQNSCNSDKTNECVTHSNPYNPFWYVGTDYCGWDCGSCGNFGGCYESSGSCVKSGLDDCGSCWDYCSPVEAGCGEENCPTDCGYNGGDVNDGSFSKGCDCGTKACPTIAPCATPTPTPACITGTFYEGCDYSGNQWCKEGTTCYTGWVTGPGYLVDCSSSEKLRDIGEYCTRWDNMRSWNGSVDCYSDAACITPSPTLTPSPTPTNTPTLTPPPPPPTLTPSPTPTLPPGRVQGSKGIVSISGVNDYFETAGVPALSVGLTCPDGYSASTTANPFSFNNLILNDDICTSTVINMTYYERGWTMCYDDNSCHTDPATITPGGGVSISEADIIDNYIPASDPYPYADLYFHYTPLPRCLFAAGTPNPLEIRLGETVNVSATSTILIATDVVVDNHIGLYKTQKVSSPNLPPTTIGSATSLGSIRDCNSNGSCTQTATINTTGYSVGDRFNVYCRAANGLINTTPNAPASPPDLLHQCNPFYSTDSDPGYNLHPYNSNCNYGGGLDYIMVEVTEPVLTWWQTQNGNITAADGGKIISTIPATAIRPYLIDYYPLVYPNIGVLEYGSTTNPDLGSGSLNPSSAQWAVESTSSVSLSQIPYFEKKFPQDVRDAMEGPNLIVDGTLNQTELNNIGNGTGYTMARGYYAFYYSGSTLNIGDIVVTNDALNIANGKRVIIYAPNADVNINADIHFTDGKAFFMLIAGGNISVDAADVGGNPSDSIPDLEGVFYTNGSFSSGISQTQLHVKGIVTAGSYNLGRKLFGGTWSDDFYAGELFEYDPAQTLMFPAFLALRTYSRQEVAP